MKINVTVDTEDNAIDIPTMYKLPADQYATYVDGGLFRVDHHDVLRAVLGEYPIATTPEQVKQLIGYLQGVAEKMQAARE
jgi:hypothetical protein